MITKFILKSFAVIVMLITLICCTYGFLIRDNIFHCSISAIIHQAHQSAPPLHHVLILVLLPIYIAAIIFGACILGIYLGTKLKQFFQK